MTRVREMLERSRRSLLDGTARQRLEGSTKQLWQRSRATVASLVGPSAGTEQADSQDVLAGVCSSVALRDLNIVDSLLEQLEKMEADEDDPAALAQLYKLDHLVTRLRRNGENLRVLAGRDAGYGPDEPSSLVDVIRAAMSSIEHYTRVELGKVATLGVIGFAADDVSRLLAELLDNATGHSPPASTVTVGAHLTERGSVLVRIEDNGIGLPAARLSALNERLASSPVLDRNSVQHMGLAVVRRLSARHGVNVWLARRAPHGTVATVVLPATLIQDALSNRDAPRNQDNPVNRDASVNRQQQAAQAMSTPNEANKPARAGNSVRLSGGLDASRDPEPTSEPSTTRNGLPKRVPQSLKASPAPVTSGNETNPDEQRIGHEQLLDDLDAFVEGEQAAHGEHATTETDNSGGGQEK